MKMIACPNCGKLLESKEGKDGPFSEHWVVRCPRCGNVPLLEDSQIITISSGEMGGPGLRNFQDKQRDILIHGGKSSEKGRLEEPVIEAQEAVIESKSNVAKNPNFISAPAPTSHKQEATVEELSDTFNFDLKAMKEPARPGATPGAKKNKLASPGQTHRRPGAPTVKSSSSGETVAAASGEKTRKATRNMPRMPKRVYPWYYQLIFYGVPGILLLSLVWFTLYQVFSHKEAPTTAIGPLAIWNKAEESQQLGYVAYREAIEASNAKNNQLYAKKLFAAKDRYDEALRLAKDAWQAQIQLLMQEQKLTQQQAAQYAQQYYGKYPQTIQQWESYYLAIQEKCKTFEKKRK